MRSAGIVAIDVEQRWTGGHYYLQHLIKCVAALPPQERIVLRDVWWITKPETDPFKDVRDLLGEAIVVSPPSSFMERLLRRLNRFFSGSKDARDLFDAQKIDVFFPRPPCDNSGTPYVFWVPDFQHTRRPDLVSDELRQRFNQYFDHHVHAAAQIVLSSEDARRDFAAVYPELLGRTHIVRFCSVPDDEWWKLEPKNVADRHGLPDRFFIVCNQFTRHKNHLTLLQALHLLAEIGHEDIHVVFTGNTFDYRQEDYIGQLKTYIKQHGLGHRIHILGLIPRAEQIALLRRSIAVLQPSWFEGWSTVVEDAKTLGKPVLASDLPVHREQLGTNHPYYLGLTNPEEWAGAVASAWGRYGAGPQLAEEKAGLASLERARRSCGTAFVKALQAAIEPSNRELNGFDINILSSGN